MSASLVPFISKEKILSTCAKVAISRIPLVI
jgi:hypothetical protein